MVHSVRKNISVVKLMVTYVFVAEWLKRQSAYPRERWIKSIQLHFLNDQWAGQQNILK